jgi:mono/diheme cytochrome c family protein
VSGKELDVLRFVSAMVVVELATSLMCAATARADEGAFGSDERFMARDGAALYRGICQGCHMPDGKGAVGAGRYPPLAGNERLEIAGYPVFIVVNGQKGMPGFGAWLDDAQVAAVVNYVRSHFGNAWPDEVSPDEVAAVR